MVHFSVKRIVCSNHHVCFFTHLLLSVFYGRRSAIFIWTYESILKSLSRACVNFFGCILFPFLPTGLYGRNTRCAILCAPACPDAAFADQPTDEVTGTNKRLHANDSEDVTSKRCKTVATSATSPGSIAPATDSPAMPRMLNPAAAHRGHCPYYLTEGIVRVQMQTDVCTL